MARNSNIAEPSDVVAQESAPVDENYTGEANHGVEAEASDDELVDFPGVQRAYPHQKEYDKLLAAKGSRGKGIKVPGKIANSLQSKLREQDALVTIVSRKGEDTVWIGYPEKERTKRESPLKGVKRGPRKPKVAEVAAEEASVE